MNYKIKNALVLTIAFAFVLSMSACVAKSYCAAIALERADEGGTYIDTNAQKTMGTKIGETEKTLNYEYNIRCETPQMDKLVYKDGEGNLFEYVGDKLTGFLYKTPGGRLLLETPPDGVDEAVIEFLKTRVDIDKYTLTERKEFKIHSNEGSKVSSVDYLFQKKSGDFLTADCIRVRADNNKNIFSYNIYNEGLLDKVKIPEIDRSKCIAELEKKLNEYFSANNAKMESYTITEETLTLTRQSKLAVKYTASVKARTNAENQEIAELIYIDVIIN